MTKDNAKEYLPLVQAMIEGKRLQMRSVISDQWIDGTDWDFTCEPSRYRIKPEPKLRPWRPEEVPLGAQIRSNDVGPSVRMLICTAWNHGLKAQDNSTGGHPILFEMALNRYQHSTDGGKTWHPCGILES